MEGSNSWGIDQGETCDGCTLEVRSRGTKFSGGEKAGRVCTWVVYVEVSQHEGGGRGGGDDSTSAQGFSRVPREVVDI